MKVRFFLILGKYASDQPAIKLRETISELIFQKVAIEISVFVIFS